MAAKARTAEEEQALLIARATEEREKLFQRYERGREPGAEIDPWEDPGFEVYHQTDRYGFIHDKRLPQKPNPNEQKAKEIELERVKKWLKMLDKWSAKDTQEKVRRRVYKGIPDKLRSKVWMKLLNLEQVMQGKENVYQDMLRLARRWGTEARQIDSDVNRQFREHLFYRERYSIKQRSLFNVLTAYSMYNMEVGYCQGMSGVAGVLLMYMDEEEAFWALSTLLSDKKYALHGLYIEGFPKLTRFLDHHDRILAKFLPKLKQHMDQFELHALLYSMKWFFVIFVERIPFSLCLRVWDVFMMDGERVMTAMAYTILRLHRSRLLKLRDMDAILAYIQVQLYKDFGFEEDHVIKTLEQASDELRKTKMDLPPAAGDNEFPKKPFGVFIEPSFESQLGLRRSLFTEKEREVTETVKLKRQLTEQENEINNNEDEGTRIMGQKALGSIGHLNSAHMAESEDGGSLLGSSRKSLADTSVTSTADLSIFSGGQRSQHTFDENGHTISNSNIQYDLEDANVTEEGGHIPEEEDNESSPGSAFCSMSIVGRPSSRLRITPTPRAVSPHDIVRIYVPPPPPEELLYERPTDLRLHTTTATVSSEGRSPESDCRTVIQRTPTELPGSVSTATITSHSVGVLRQSRRRSQEEANGGVMAAGSLEGTLRDLAIYGSQTSLTHGRGSTSSSRRGSMSRKSTLIVESTELAMECSHMRAGRDSRKNSLSNRQEFVALEARREVMVAEAAVPPKPKHRPMTSFEKLAQMNDAFYFPNQANSEAKRDSREKLQKSDDESYAMRANGLGRNGGMAGGGGGGGGFGEPPMERTKCTSDYNIQYKTRDESARKNSGGGGGAGSGIVGGLDGGVGGEWANGGEGGGHDATTKEVMKKKKQYDRFFTPDEDEDEEDYYDREGRKKGKKTVDYRGLLLLGTTEDPKEEEEQQRKRKRSHARNKRGGPQKKAAEESSSSPSSSGPTKSLLATPVNETQPLIMTEDEEVGRRPHSTVYNFKHSRGVERVSPRRRPKESDDEDADGYDEEEDDWNAASTPISSPTYSGGAVKMSRTTYYQHKTASYIPIAEERGGGGGGETVSNKIRIRINEKQ